MNIKLTLEEKIKLEIRHRAERDKQICDRIKAVLLRDEGWSVKHIAQALRLHSDTISRYLNDYNQKKKVEPDYKGSIEKLSENQAEELISYLEKNIFDKASDICAYVKEKFSIDYTVAGMTDWLKRNDFSYKNPKGQPAKANLEKQQAFLKYYSQLKEKTPENQPILFIDSVHPTMATKISRGWIRKGIDKSLPTFATRTRINISGAIELSSMKTVIDDYKTINSESTIDFFEKIKMVYSKADKIHIILDQSGYHRSIEVAEYAKKNKIKLHFLPPYSPNLNPIERLWKVMNEEVRNNYFFKSAKEFREKITEFFQWTLPNIAKSLTSRINDNFHLVEIEPANSS